MSEPATMRSPAARLAHLLLLAGLASAPAGARAETVVEPRRGLTAAQALERAAASNPSLALALLELRSAAASVAIEEEAWPFVLQLDGNLVRDESPALSLAGDVRVDAVNSAGAGAELSRALPVGTRLSLRLQGDRSLREQSSFRIVPDVPAYGVLARLSVVQPLLRGFGAELGEAGLRAARIELDAAGQSRRTVASALARDVLTAYFELWYAQAALAIEEASRALAERQRREAELRVEAGTLAAVEVLPFDSRLASLEEAVSRARQERRVAAVALARLLGDPAAASEDLEAVESPEAPALPGVADAVTKALAVAPELAELEVELRLARERASIAGEALRPRLDLTASVDAEGLGADDPTPALGQVARAEAVGARLGVVYELPFAARAREAEAARASIAVRQVEERLRAERNRIEAEVRARSEARAAAAERLRLAGRTVEIARAQLAAESERFAAGAGTPVTVREAEDALRQAELRVAQARVDEIRAALALRHLLGALLAEAGAR